MLEEYEKTFKRLLGKAIEFIENYMSGNSYKGLSGTEKNKISNYFNRLRDNSWDAGPLLGRVKSFEKIITEIEKYIRGPKESPRNNSDRNWHMGLRYSLLPRSGQLSITDVLEETRKFDRGVRNFLTTLSPCLAH